MSIQRISMEEMEKVNGGTQEDYFQDRYSEFTEAWNKYGLNKMENQGHQKQAYCDDWTMNYSSMSADEYVQNLSKKIGNN